VRKKVCLESRQNKTREDKKNNIKYRIRKDKARQARHAKLRQGNARQRHAKYHNNKTRKDKEYGPDICFAQYRYLPR
jgi:hypothetical protein